MTVVPRAQAGIEREALDVNAREVIASAFVDGFTPVYLNVSGFGPLTKTGPGQYQLPHVPFVPEDIVFLATPVSFAGPIVATPLAVDPAVAHFLCTDLAGTPTDCLLSVIVMKAR